MAVRHRHGRGSARARGTGARVGGWIVACTLAALSCSPDPAYFGQYAACPLIAHPTPRLVLSASRARLEFVSSELVGHHAFENDRVELDFPSPDDRTRITLGVRSLDGEPVLGPAYRWGNAKPRPNGVVSPVFFIRVASLSEPFPETYDCPEAIGAWADALWD